MLNFWHLRKLFLFFFPNFHGIFRLTDFCGFYCSFFMRNEEFKGKTNNKAWFFFFLCSDNFSCCSFSISIFLVFMQFPLCNSKQIVRCTDMHYAGGRNYHCFKDLSFRFRLLSISRIFWTFVESLFLFLNFAPWTKQQTEKISFSKSKIQNSW